MMQHHKYSLTELENMMPFEREIYLGLLEQYIREETEKAEREKRQNTQKKQKTQIEDAKTLCFTMLFGLGEEKKTKKEKSKTQND